MRFVHPLVHHIYKVLPSAHILSSEPLVLHCNPVPTLVDIVYDEVEREWLREGTRAVKARKLPETCISGTVF